MFGLIYLRYPVQMLVSCPSLAALGTRDIGRMQTKQKTLAAQKRLATQIQKRSNRIRYFYALAARIGKCIIHTKELT
jgi:hypothetical protein